MEKEIKKLKRRNYIFLGISFLFGWLYLEERSRADKLEGVVDNLEKTNKGLQKTVGGLAHALGKKIGKDEMIKYGK